MNLRHFRAFIVIAEDRSFRRAAQRLHISPAPLSRQIRALEEELGLRLLERERNNRISLTDAGHSFLTDARRTVAAADAALRNAQEAVRGSSGELHVANIPALSTAVLPQLLNEFHKNFPKLKVFLIEMEPAEQLAAVLAKRIHLAIFPDLGAPLDEGLMSRLLFSCPMVAVLPTEHELARTTGEISIAELAGETILLPSLDAYGYRARFQQLCSVADFTPRVTHPVDGMENLLGMIGAGYGVAILPEVLVNSLLPSCRTRRLQTPVPPLCLRLIWLRNSSSLILQNFLTVAKRYHPPLPAR